MILVYLIREIEWVSSQVLYVVSVYTVRSVVLKRVWAPHCFVLVHVKILIPGQKMDHLNFYFGLGVGKSTKLFVIALGCFVSVSLTKFSFVATGMIHLLDFVVRKVTLIVFAVTVGAEFVAVLVRVRSAPV